MEIENWAEEEYTCIYCTCIRKPLFCEPGFFPRHSTPSLLSVIFTCPLYFLYSVLLSFLPHSLPYSENCLNCVVVLSPSSHAVITMNCCNLLCIEASMIRKVLCLCVCIYMYTCVRACVLMCVCVRVCACVHVSSNLVVGGSIPPGDGKYGEHELKCGKERGDFPSSL